MTSEGNTSKVRLNKSAQVKLQNIGDWCMAKALAAGTRDGAAAVPGAAVHGRAVQAEPGLHLG